MESVDQLLVADSLEGGLGRAVEGQVAYFAARGWRVAVAAPPPLRDLPGAVAVYDVPTPRSAMHLAALVRCALAVRRLRRSLRPAMVHAHGLRSQAIVVLGGYRPWVTRHGGGRLPGLPWHVSLARGITEPLAPLLAAQALSVSPAPGRWSVVATASPLLSTLEPAPAAAMTEPPLFLWVGRLDVPKRPDVFVDAMSRLAASVECQGVIVGAGPLHDVIAQRIQERRAPVVLAGHQTELQHWYASARALCLFSDAEGVPFSVEEAMWAGRVVVASDLPGVRWFAGDTALYADDAVDAADHLRRLLDSSVAAQLGNAAARRAREILRPDDPNPEIERRLAAEGIRPAALP